VTQHVSAILAKLRAGGAEARSAGFRGAGVARSRLAWTRSISDALVTTQRLEKLAGVEQRT
jgi:hypothetical protein